MGYIANGRRYDFNSIANQNIKSKFIRNNVYCCTTSTTDYILSQSWEDDKAPFNNDDVENFYVPFCPECHSDYGFEEVDAYECSSCANVFEKYVKQCTFCDEEETIEHRDPMYKCENCDHLHESIDDLDTKPQEVYEWWVVSGWLLEQLQAKGECIIPHMDIWGRTCTGQAILLDEVISCVCFDMGILEGQRNEWKVA